MLHLYRILEFTHPVGHAELKVRYRELAKRFHPDVCKTPGAAEHFKLLSNAYQELIKHAPKYVAPPPPKPKAPVEQKKAAQNLFRVFNSNKSHRYMVGWPDDKIEKRTRFFYMIDGREYRTFFDEEKTLPFIIEVRDAYRDETHTFYFEKVYE